MILLMTIWSLVILVSLADPIRSLIVEYCYTRQTLNLNGKKYIILRAAEPPIHFNGSVSGRKKGLYPTEIQDG